MTSAPVCSALPSELQLHPAILAVRRFPMPTGSTLSSHGQHYWLSIARGVGQGRPWLGNAMPFRPVVGHAAARLVPRSRGPACAGPRAEQRPQAACRGLRCAVPELAKPVEMASLGHRVATPIFPGSYQQPAGLRQSIPLSHELPEGHDYFALDEQIGSHGILLFRRGPGDRSS